MIEVHVDSIDAFLLGAEKDHKISIRFERTRKTDINGKPCTKADMELVILGQDETVFHANLMAAKSWFYMAQQKLRPKDKGEGLMISGITSRKFGYGLAISDDDLVRVNAYRSSTAHSEYVCEEAAEEVYGTVTKGPLVDSRFVVYFAFGSGAGRDGWWNGNEMAIQLEDVLDVMDVLYPDLFVIFELDHR